jgi:hypothetical protein
MVGTMRSAVAPMRRMPPSVTAPTRTAAPLPVSSAGDAEAGFQRMRHGVGLHHVADAEGGKAGAARRRSTASGFQPSPRSM